MSMMDLYLQGQGDFDSWLNSTGYNQQPSLSDSLLSQAGPMAQAFGTGMADDKYQFKNQLDMAKFLAALDKQQQGYENTNFDNQLNQQKFGLDTQKFGLAQNADTRAQMETAATYGDPSQTRAYLNANGISDQTLLDMFHSGDPQTFADDMKIVGPLLGLTDDESDTSWRHPAGRQQLMSVYQDVLQTQQQQQQDQQQQESQQSNQERWMALNPEERAKEAVLKFHEMQGAGRNVAVAPGGDAFYGDDAEAQAAGAAKKRKAQLTGVYKMPPNFYKPGVQKPTKSSGGGGGGRKTDAEMAQMSDAAYLGTNLLSLGSGISNWAGNRGKGMVQDARQAWNDLFGSQKPDVVKPKQAPPATLVRKDTKSTSKGKGKGFHMPSWSELFSG